MRLKLTQLCVCLLTICTGCHSLSESSKSTEAEESAVKNEIKPAFSIQKIQSKTWQDPEGDTLRFLGWSSMDFKLRGKLLIAKFGYTNTDVASYLEFYREIQTGNPDQRDKCVYIANDYMPDMVISIEPLENQNQTGIIITRETIPRSAKQRKHFRYVLLYDENYSLNPDAEIWSWDISK